MLPMDVLKTLREEQFERTADDFSLCISKNPLGTLIKQGNPVFGINRDDGVLGDFQNVLKSGLAGAYCFLSLLAVDDDAREICELSD
jgi:hypothetical protein